MSTGDSIPRTDGEADPGKVDDGGSIPPAAVAEALDGFFPDPRARQAGLAFLADAIEDAAREGAARWVVSLRDPPKINLTVGRAYVVSFQRGVAYIPVDAASVDELTRQALNLVAVVIDERFASVPDSLTYKVAAAEFATAGPLLRAANAAFIRKAAATVRQTPYARAHCPAIIELLATELHRELPQPAYDSLSGTGSPDRAAGRLARARAGGGTVNLEFDPRVLDRVRATRDRMRGAGQLLAPEALSGYLTRFRAKYGAEVLDRLSGTALLDAMHGRKSRDSLMYWLEFKNDEDFAGPRLGSISGGSALKFGIYEKADTGAWMTGSARTQKVISREEAVAFAKSQRDELLAAVAVLDELGPVGTFDAGAADFDALDAKLRAAMPALYESGWSHKYLSLLYPDRIDDYHSYAYQVFHHVRLLVPPREGRFAAAQTFLALAKSLNEPVQQLTAILNELHGGPYSYWRLGTVIDGKSQWDAMRQGGYAAVGWASLGDLGDVALGDVDKDAWQKRYADKHPHAHAPTEASQRRQLLDFVRNAQERDVVVAVDGQTVLGIGTITGAYEYHPERGAFVNARPVQWRSDATWKLDEGLRSTFRQLRGHDTWLTIEQELFGRQEPTTRASPTGPANVPPTAALPPLDPIVGRVDRILRRKGQVILYGPPGTGKTYWGECAVFELASRAWFERTCDGERRAALVRDGAIEVCSFHPAYGYEDFLEGYRPAPASDGGAMNFERRDGVFKRLCARASAEPARPFYLLIDEINRGDIPRIFGELLSALEWDKRGKTYTLPLSGQAFAVPANVFVVGTMNTADRSIALLDAALRRRFGFVELMPSSEPLHNAMIQGLPLGAWLVALNRRILDNVGRDARNLQVGHAYLLERGAPVSTSDRFVEVLQEDVIPLLQEYCYEDFPLLEKILGKSLVDVAQRRIKDGLFAPSRRLDLFAALAAEFPDLGTSGEAQSAAQADGEEDDEEAEV